MDGVRHVEFRRQLRIELMDVPPVAHDALAVRDVEVAGHFIHQHMPRNHAAFVGAQAGEVLRAIVDALGGVPQHL